MVGIDGADARVVRDLAVLERDVEVDPHEDALARGVDVADRELVHAASVDAPARCRHGQRAPATKAIRSATRQL